jgi:GNAT superfamily N-acetyltransferase
MNCEIRFLAQHPGLVPVLARWAWNEWYREGDIDCSIVTRDYSRRAVRDRLPCTLVALCDGEPAGMVSLKKKDLASRPDLEPWLSALFVREDLRCRGIAGQLVEQVCGLARSFGYDRLYLFADHRHAAGLSSFYVKRGWSAVDTGLTLHGHLVTLFERKLPVKGEFCLHQ